MIKRIIPKSLQRQLQVSQPVENNRKNKAQFVECEIKGKRVKINARCLPDDLPSINVWFRTRIWVDEISGRSLT